MLGAKPCLFRATGVRLDCAQFHTEAGVIVIEFLIFVVSSGLFYSGRFRHHLWAVVVAGVIATASSVLFFYDLYEKLQAHPEAPVRVVKQVVRVPVIRHVSQPAMLSKPENCRDDYPFFARVFGREGTTELAFHRVGRRHGARCQGRQDQRLGRARRGGGGVRREMALPPRAQGRSTDRCTDDGSRWRGTSTTRIRKKSTIRTRSRQETKRPGVSTGPFRTCAGW